MSNLTSVAAVRDAKGLLRTAHRSNGHIADGVIQSWHRILNRGGNGTTTSPPANFPTPAPTGGGSCDRSLQGALELPADPGGGHVFRLLNARVTPSGLPGGIVMIADRHTEVGGLAWNTTAPQAITMPALSARAPTNGEGLWLCLEDFTIPSVPAITTMTVTYTNTAGGSSTSSVATTPQNGHLTLGHFMELATGDSGVKAATSVSLSANAGTSAGNFGFSIIEPLAFFDMGMRGSQPNPVGAEIADWLDCALARVHPQACLQVMHINQSTTSNLNGSMNVELDLGID